MASTVQTYQGIIDALTETVQRDDLLSQYLDITNRAVRELALKHSFTEMKATGAAIIPMGQTLVVMPTDFKELQAGRYPIFDAVPNQLVSVFARPEIEKLLSAGFVDPTSLIYTEDSSTGVARQRVELQQAATVDHNLTVYYFAYPAPCTDPSGGATTPLIVYFENLVKLKAFSIAFESVNDPVYMVHEKQFLLELNLETGEDVKQAISAMRGDKPQ